MLKSVDFISLWAQLLEILLENDIIEKADDVIQMSDGKEVDIVNC